MPGQIRQENAGRARDAPRDENPVVTIRLSLLGPFLLSDAEGREISIASKKNRLLLALLAVAPALSLSRDVLAGLLWAEHSEEQAHNSMRQAIAVLRRELDGHAADVFASSDTVLALKRETLVIDTESFERDASVGIAPALQRAVALWRGPFLADVAAPDNNLEQWLAERREHYNALYAAAMDRLVPLLTGQEQIEMARRLVHFDNLREASHRRLMETYAAQSERAQALRHYENMRRLLRMELGVEPSPETRALRDQIAGDGHHATAQTSPPPTAAAVEMVIEPGPSHATPPGPGPISAKSSRRIAYAAAAAMVLAVISAANWFLTRNPPGPVVEPSVAVLPFESLSGDPDDARIAEGLTIDTITDLSRFWDFKVFGRDSTEVYNGKPVDLRQIGRDLKASHILKGTFQRNRNHVRITAQLIDAETGTALWSVQFDRPAGEVFALQTDVADHIAESLGSHNGMVTGSVLTAAKRKRPADLGAYEIYLLARDKLQTDMSSEGMIEAEHMLDRALAIDPTFARAYVLYAWTYAWRHTFEGGADVLVKEMLKYARRGVDLDPMDADAQQALGYANGLSGNLVEAQVQFEQSLKLNPNSFDILTIYSCWAHAFGNAKAGAEAAYRALALNPNFPNWSIACLRLGLFLDGHYEDAIRVQSRQPEDKWNTDGFAVTASSLAALGRKDEAQALARRGIKQFPGLLSVEKFALNRNWASDAVPVFSDLMRKAGFPVCATEKELADTPNPVRLPDCNASSAGSQHAALSIPAIAVLSFDNLAGDETNGRIADGITDDIITELSRFRDLDVIARNSTEVYKGKPIDVRQIGKDLNVGYVLEGSFQRQSDHIRINIQLIDTSTGHQIFSERYDNPSEDLFAVQAEVAAKVANSLGGVDGVVSTADLLAAKRKQETDLNAYALYLLGDEARRELTEESELQAEKILKQAIVADPTLARAHTSLANTYSRLMLFQTDMAPSTKLMVEESRRAVELDPLDARAHAALAYAAGMTGDLRQAEIEYDKALGLSPNAFDVLKSYSCWAFAFGKGEAGALAVDRAIRLNPRYPDHGVDCFRYALFMVGRYEDAIRAQRRLPEEKWNPDGFAMTAGSLAALGQMEEAKALAVRGFAKFPSVLSVEKFALNRGWSAQERDKLRNLMQKAGFPLCAHANDFGKDYKAVRLPECSG
jgi:TolB-like protein/DNA-binding SARP family transcriptional activator/Tfp pilus assembly protein PilF